MNQNPRTSAVLLTEDLAARAGIAASTLRSYLARGEMPAPDGQIGGKFNYWREDRHDVAEWIETRLSSRRSTSTEQGESQ